MVRENDEIGNYKSGQPNDDKRAERREMLKRCLWLGLVKSYVAERDRYAADREAAAMSAPERRRGWVKGNDRLLVLLAVLDAWQDWQAADESGTRRAVPAGIEMLADVLTALGFGEGVTGETLDGYVAEWLEYLRRSGRLKMVRNARRVTGEKGDGDAREYLTYLGGREFVLDEPHAEPRCWKKPKLVEQPREPRCVPKPTPSAEVEWKESLKRLEVEQREQAEWDATRSTNPTPNPNEPTQAQLQYMAEDAANTAQVKFESAAKAKPEVPRNGARDQKHATLPKPAQNSESVSLPVPNAAAVARMRDEPPKAVEPRPPKRTPSSESVNDRNDWLFGEVVGGRMSMPEAERRGFRHAPSIAGMEF